MIVAAVLVVGAAGIGTIYALQQSHPKLQPVPVVTAQPSAPHIQAQEGKDQTPVSPSVLSVYKVAADAPRAIYIDKLGIAARILPMGINADKSMQAPINIYDAGWYTSSAKPGNSYGAMVVDGHASKSGTHYGLFGNLDKLVEGDTMTIERGDGTKYQYTVAHTEDVPEDQVNMNKVMESYGDATRGLNLITCAGEWTKDGSTLDHRFIVYAVPTT